MSDAPSARRAHIVAAATSVFLRYGFGRTTMADIAQASGRSRPTLYLTFPDKESVFRAMIEAKMAQVRTGISGLPPFARSFFTPAMPGQPRVTNWCRRTPKRATCSISGSSTLAKRGPRTVRPSPTAGEADRLHFFTKAGHCDLGARPNHH